MSMPPVRHASCLTGIAGASTTFQFTGVIDTSEASILKLSGFSKKNSKWQTTQNCNQGGQKTELENIFLDFPSSCEVLGSFTRNLSSILVS
jgi:hypothetical protein